MSPASAQRRRRGLNLIPKENVAFTAPLDQAPPESFASTASANPVWEGARKWEEKSLFHKFVRRESWVEAAGPRQRPCSRTRGDADVLAWPQSTPRAARPRHRFSCDVPGTGESTTAKFPPGLHPAVAITDGNEGARGGTHEHLDIPGISGTMSQDDGGEPARAGELQGVNSRALPLPHKDGDPR